MLLCLTLQKKAQIDGKSISFFSYLHLQIFFSTRRAESRQIRKQKRLIMIVELIWYYAYVYNSVIFALKPSFKILRNRAKFYIWPTRSQILSLNWWNTTYSLLVTKNRKKRRWPRKFQDFEKSQEKFATVPHAHKFQFSIAFFFVFLFKKIIFNQKIEKNLKSWLGLQSNKEFTCLVSLVSYWRRMDERGMVKSSKWTLDNVYRQRLCNSLTIIPCYKTLFSKVYFRGRKK